LKNNIFNVLNKLNGYFLDQICIIYFMTNESNNSNNIYFLDIRNLEEQCYLRAREAIRSIIDQIFTYLLFIL